MPKNFSGELDFFELKEDFRSFLKNQPIYKGYNFDGTNFDVLFDVLAYNTNLNAYMHNMVATESNLSSAQQRSNVLAHVAPLNYIGRSYESATAVINLEVLVTNPTVQEIRLPAGFRFNGSLNNTVYTFQTLEAHTAYRIADRFIFKNLKIYEGKLVQELFRVKNSNKNQRFTISNKRVNISTLKVNVFESSASTSNYEVIRSNTLLGVDGSSNVFFIENSSNEKYDIVFGDGVLGRGLEVNNIVRVEYLVSSGPVVNGVSSFSAAQLIEGFQTLVTTISPAAGGSEFEDIESIRLNAPRYFQTQGRAITDQDYASLIMAKFNDIREVNVFGGEEVGQYGKIFISCVTKSGSPLSNVRTQEIQSYLRDKKNPDIRLVFQSPDFLQIVISSVITYNSNITTLTRENLRSKVANELSKYSLNKLNRFKNTLAYSKLVEFIDDIDDSIVSNETKLTMLKSCEALSYQPYQMTYTFNNPVSRESSLNFYSSNFNIGGAEFSLRDDRAGNVKLFSISNGVLTNTVGTIDYSTGTVSLSLPSAIYNNNQLNIFAVPASQNIKAILNIITQINMPLSTIVVETT